MCWKKKSGQGECHAVQININVFVARLRLYQDELSKLRPLQTLCFDTDSSIYSQKGDEPILPLGDFLDEFTIELDDANDHIVEFASTGPNN